MTREARCLVIDTDIARAAGGPTAQEVRPKVCHDFLKAVREHGHKVITTETIRAEWKKHQSRFTSAWFVSMLARKKVCWVNALADEELRHKIEQVTMNEKKQSAMLKDVHLIEAALRADKTVISMDETVRTCFSEATGRIGVLKQIAWVNPDNREERAIEWLQEGAEREQERLLGYHKGP